MWYLRSPRGHLSQRGASAQRRRLSRRPAGAVSRCRSAGRAVARPGRLSCTWRRRHSRGARRPYLARRRFRPRMAALSVRGRRACSGAPKTPATNLARHALRRTANALVRLRRPYTRARRVLTKQTAPAACAQQPEARRSLSVSALACTTRQRPSGGRAVRARLTLRRGASAQGRRKRGRVSTKQTGSAGRPTAQQSSD